MINTRLNFLVVSILHLRHDASVAEIPPHGTRCEQFGVSRIPSPCDILRPSFTTAYFWNDLSFIGFCEL